MFSNLDGLKEAKSKQWRRKRKIGPWHREDFLTKKSYNCDLVSLASIKLKSLRVRSVKQWWHNSLCDYESLVMYHTSETSTNLLADNHSWLSAFSKNLCLYILENWRITKNKFWRFLENKSLIKILRVCMFFINI